MTTIKLVLSEKYRYNFRISTYQLLFDKYERGRLIARLYKNIINLSPCDYREGMYEFDIVSSERKSYF